MTRAEAHPQETVVHRYVKTIAVSDAAAVDPVTIEVVRHALISAAEQMKRALVRTAFNPIIYEVLDFAVAIYDRHVRLLSQALGMQHFMGRLSFGIEASVAAVGGEEKLEPGDILFYNVPYLSGAHANDGAVHAGLRRGRAHRLHSDHGALARRRRQGSVLDRHG